MSLVVLTLWYWWWWCYNRCPLQRYGCGCGGDYRQSRCHLQRCPWSWSADRLSSSCAHQTSDMEKVENRQMLKSSRKHCEKCKGCPAEFKISRFFHPYFTCLTCNEHGQMFPEISKVVSCHIFQTFCQNYLPFSKSCHLWSSSYWWLGHGSFWFVDLLICFFEHFITISYK